MSVIEIVLVIVIFLATAAFWELVAWFMHKYVMHGWGWFLHEDHHKTTGRRFQKNDAYALFFASVSFLGIFFGLKLGVSYLAAFGFGVALYGVGYATFHEIMFHKRIRWIRYSPKARYMKRIINAHRVHHGTVTKEGAKSFSFLYSPVKYTPKD